MNHPPNGSNVDPPPDGSLADLVEEYANRLQAGENVDPEELVRKHPEHAEQLRQLLPAAAALAGLGQSAAARQGVLSACLDQVSRSGSTVFSNFRIVCEIGRGGMGVVYEAEQLSLRRRVAL